MIPSVHLSIPLDPSEKALTAGLPIRAVASEVPTRLADVLTDFHTNLLTQEPETELQWQFSAILQGLIKQRKRLWRFLKWVYP